MRDWLANSAYQGFVIIPSKVHIHLTVRADDTTSPPLPVGTNHTNEIVQTISTPAENRNWRGGRGDDGMVLWMWNGVVGVVGGCYKVCG